ncbi:hypothetical protein TNCV_3430911 [Trichonephila clavipes]|nr:hypothetical protein TNCV_3430911 [Trichonephila clavipes]
MRTGNYLNAKECRLVVIKTYPGEYPQCQSDVKLFDSPSGVPGSLKGRKLTRIFNLLQPLLRQLFFPSSKTRDRGLGDIRTSRIKRKELWWPLKDGVTESAVLNILPCIHLHGNELANKSAKEAWTLHPSCLPIPLRNAKQFLRDKYRQKRICTLIELAVSLAWSCLLDGQRRAQFSVLPGVEGVTRFSHLRR